MIIGSIVNGGNASPGGNGNDGYSTIMFYTMSDAVTWATLQSSTVSVEGTDLNLLCTVINTETNVHRWWYNGTEYTG
jgi:hypothetical protein